MSNIETEVMPVKIIDPQTQVIAAKMIGEGVPANVVVKMLNIQSTKSTVS